jgi:hypothetical protein
MDHVKQVGASAFIDEQFATPASIWPAFRKRRCPAVDAFLPTPQRTGSAQQRVIGALSEIFVISGLGVNTRSSEIVPGKLLSRNALELPYAAGEITPMPRWAIP